MLNNEDISYTILGIARNIEECKTLDEAKDLAKNLIAVSEYKELKFKDGAFSASLTIKHLEEIKEETKQFIEKYKGLISLLPNMLSIRHDDSGDLGVEFSSKAEMKLFEYYGLTDKNDYNDTKLSLTSDGIKLLSSAFDLTYISHHEVTIEFTDLSEFATENLAKQSLMNMGYSLSDSLEYYCTVVDEHSDHPGTELTFKKTVDIDFSGFINDEIKAILFKEPKYLSSIHPHLTLERIGKNKDAKHSITKGVHNKEGIDGFYATFTSEDVDLEDFSWEGYLEIISKKTIRLPSFIGLNKANSIRSNNILFDIQSILESNTKFKDSSDEIINKALLSYEPEASKDEINVFQIIDDTIQITFNDKSVFLAPKEKEDDENTYQKLSSNIDNVTFDLIKSDSPVEMPSFVLDGSFYSNISTNILNGSLFIPNDNRNLINSLTPKDDSYMITVNLHQTILKNDKTSKLPDITDGVNLSQCNSGKSVLQASYSQETKDKKDFKFTTRHQISVVSEYSNVLPEFIKENYAENILLNGRRVKVKQSINHSANKPSRSIASRIF